METTLSNGDSYFPKEQETLLETVPTCKDSHSLKDQEKLLATTLPNGDSHSPKDQETLMETKLPKGDSHFSKEKETLIKKTFAFLKCGEKEIELHNQFKQVVLVLGDTGNGKTKFTQWIVGDNTKLIAKETEENTGEYVIQDINGTGSSTITSDTMYPQLMVDGETNIPYYDCPGFNDTRDTSNEIATTYFIKKIMDFAESVKMIFVISYPSVRKGVERHNFMKLVKHISDFIKDIEKFKTSVALVVTKVDNLYIKQGNSFTLVDDVNIIKAIANFLIEVRQDLEAKLEDGPSKERQLCKAAVNFISIFLIKDGDQYTRIGIFRRPDQPGPLNKILLLQEEKRHMKSIINQKLTFTAKENEDFSYTISEKCKNDIHYLVEEINRNVWFSLSQVKYETEKYYCTLVNTIRNTLKSFVSETSDQASNLDQARELLDCLKAGCRIINKQVKHIARVTNPEDLARIINTVISDLDIEISRNNVQNIQNQGMYINFLQAVSDRKLSFWPWEEFFIKIDVYLSNAWKKIQEDIDDVTPEICTQIKSDFQQITKALQDRFDENMKPLDIKEVQKVISLYHNSMIKIIEKTKTTMSITELLKIVRDVTRDINIILPKHNALSAIRLEKYFRFLKAIGETKVNFEPLAWTEPFQDLIQYLNDSKIWYRIVEDLYAKFSEYEIQKNRGKYNVAVIEDWGKTNKPQGINVTKSNFEQCLVNITNFNNSGYNNARSITSTELRLEELNHLLNLTLKHRADIQYSPPSIFIKEDYVSIKEIATHIKHGLENNYTNFGEALKSGEYKFLHIFASKKVFIDNDVSFPGLELRIISPEWEIIGTRTISLDGVDGEPHLQITAEDGNDSGCNGEDGKPGKPGHPGGNFFGIGASFINGENLTITVNGGNGGQGQHGGKGREGAHGRDVEYLTDDDLPSLNGDGATRIKGFLCEIISEWNDVAIFAGPTVNTLYKVYGLPGQTGGNGGKGGKGGRGGNAGNVLIFDLNYCERIVICANKGRDGLDGNGGEGGRGGKYGQDTSAQLRSQPASLPVVSEAQQTKEWVHQFNVPNKMRASSGQNGSDGANIRVIKLPADSNVLSEPFKIINAYKSYAMQNLKFRFKKVLLLDFITLLNGNDEIGNIYDIYGFIDELKVLEEEYSKLNKHLDFIPFYQSMLERIAQHAKRIERSENFRDYTKVLYYLYTAVLSMINIRTNESQTNLIIDISRHLDILKKDIEEMKDLQMTFNKISMKNKLNEDYKRRITKRIEEANYFILKQILPEVKNIGEQIDDKIRLLIDETIKLQEKTKNQKQNLIIKRKELQRSLALKLVFRGLNFISKAVSYLGPFGESVGSVIGTAASVSESLISNDNETPLDEDSSAIPNLQTIEKEIKTFQNETLSCFNKLLKEILKDSEEHPDFLQDTREKIEIFQKQRSSENKLGLYEIKEFENKLKLEFKTKEDMIKCQPDDQKSKASLQVIRKLKRFVKFNSIMLYFVSESDGAKLNEISKAIEQKEEKFQYLKLYEDKIYSSIIPMIDTIENYLYDIGSKLDSKSPVILDITKWQVQRTLKNVQLQMRELTRGFKAESQIARCVELLHEALVILINIYDQIQHYQEQQNLVDYIADISFDTTSSIVISDPKLSYALNQLDIVIKSNLVLKQYKTALHAFSQWVFPFSENYIRKSMLPSHIETEKTVENLVSAAASHIEYMKAKVVDVCKASVMKKDKHLHYGEFNSRNRTTEPFFAWKNREYKCLLWKLLSGQEVVLKADVKKSPANKQAIKFNCIDFHFKTNIESLQHELTEAMKRYDIMATHMGYSYFRFGDKIYLITSDSQTVYYSFEKSATGECVRSNAVYNKIKNGDLMLSPYSVWKVKLIDSTNKDSFEDLNKYKNDVSLELAGYGSYVTEGDSFNIVDDSYNIIELYTELDQCLDLVDF